MQLHCCVACTVGLHGYVVTWLCCYMAMQPALWVFILTQPTSCSYVKSSTAMQLCGFIAPSIYSLIYIKFWSCIVSHNPISSHVKCTLLDINCSINFLQTLEINQWRVKTVIEGDHTHRRFDHLIKISWPVPWTWNGKVGEVKTVRDNISTPSGFPSGRTNQCSCKSSAVGTNETEV